jgi:hypothetical protein
MGDARTYFGERHVSLAFEKEVIALVVGDFPLPHKLEDAVLPQCLFPPFLPPPFFS